MKRVLFFVPFVAACFLAGPGRVGAETFQGTLKAVNREARKMNLETERGPEVIRYSDETQWPSDVFNPEDIRGRAVEVSVDDVTGEVLSVAVIE